jgi:hypothetical protein
MKIVSSLALMVAVGWIGVVRESPADGHKAIFCGNLS